MALIFSADLIAALRGTRPSELFGDVEFLSRGNKPGGGPFFNFETDSLSDNDSSISVLGLATLVII
jgi:hypothetical protein